MSETTETTETADGHSAHVKPRYDDVDIPVIVLLGTFSAVMTFVIICFLQGLYYSWSESIKQQDWNSVALTPEEKIIVKQKKLRNSFFETEDGEIYVSVDTAARKLLDAKGDLSLIKAMPTDDAPAPAKAEPAKVESPKAEASKAEAPKAEASKTEPEKSSSEPPGPDEPAKTESDEKTKTESEPKK